MNRLHPERRWLVEIVGFWTEGYLASKLRSCRAAGVPNLILCIDEARACAGARLPRDARVVWFRRKVDAQAVLALIEQAESAGAHHVPEVDRSIAPRA